MDPSRGGVMEGICAEALDSTRQQKANISVYLTSPVGIGEHPDLISAIDTEMEKAAEADDKLTFLVDQLDW